MNVKPHLLLPEILHPTHQRQIEADTKAVLEEEWRPAAVQLPFGDDGDAVTQQVGLVHVVGGQDHSPSCTGVQFLEQRYAGILQNFSYSSLTFTRQNGTSATDTEHLADLDFGCLPCTFLLKHTSFYSNTSHTNISTCYLAVKSELTR